MPEDALSLPIIKWGWLCKGKKRGDRNAGTLERAPGAKNLVNRNSKKKIEWTFAHAHVGASLFSHWVNVAIERVHSFICVFHWAGSFTFYLLQLSRMIYSLSLSINVDIEEVHSVIVFCHSLTLVIKQDHSCLLSSGSIHSLNVDIEQIHSLIRFSH